MKLISWTGIIFLLTVLLVVVSRLMRTSSAPRRRIFALVAPLLWVGATLFFLDLAFIDIIQYGNGLRLDNIVKIASASALVTLPLTLLPVGMRKWVAILLSILFPILIFADLLYMRHFGNVAPFRALRETHQLMQLGDSIVALISPMDIWLLFVPVAALFFAAVYKPVKVQWPNRLLQLRTHGIIFLIFVLASLPSIIVLDASMHKKIFSKVAFVDKLGVINIHLLDILQTTREYMLSTKLTPEDRQRVMRFFTERASKIPENGKMYGCARGKNLIIIQVESLEQWVVNKKVDGQDITPFLNRLSKEALYYPYFFDQTYDGGSSDADFMALNSLYPLHRGIIAFRRPQNRFVALPLLLKHAGYTTLSATAEYRHFLNMGIVYPRYGFEHSLFRRELGIGEEISGRLTDGIFLKRLILEIKKLPEPFFTFIVTCSSHHPYRLPAKHKGLNIGKLEGTLLGDYIHAIHYEDRCLEQFFSDLKETGLLENSVVAIYGDHNVHSVNQELLSDTEYARQWQQAKILSSLDRVPFFVAVPGLDTQGEMPAVGGHVDIAPTLLYLLGIKQPVCFMGKPLPSGGFSVAVLPKRWGSVVTQERMFLTEATGISKNEGCFEFPSGNPLPAASCKDLAQRTDEELEVSKLVVLHDLAWEIAGFDEHQK